MGRTTITRRCALALGAAAGLAPLLARTPLAGAATRVAPRPRGFTLDVRPQDFDGRLTPPLRAPRRFDLLGVRGADALRGGLQVRARPRGGRWSAWIPVAVHGDHAPDTGSGERASDPIWFGDGAELQLRVADRPRGPLRVHLVAVPRSARRRLSRRSLGRAAQAAAPGTPPPIIPREAWGPGFTPRTTPDYGQVQAAFVHHTVGANDYTPEQSAAIVLGIAKYHRDTNGWNDIGYNFLVDQYGQVFEGRGGGVEMAVVGAQAQGYNSFSTSVAHLGTYGATPISEPAMQATAQLLGWKMSLHGVPCEGQVQIVSGGGDLNRYAKGTVVTFERISGHRDGDATSCPGDALYAQLAELRRRATALAGPIRAQGGVTLLPAEASVLYGDDAVFTGTVIRTDSTAGAGEPVVVQKVGPSGRWVTIARTTAGPDGSWSVRLPWRRGADVRATAAGLVSKPVTVAVAARLSARAAAKRVRAGDSIRLSGRVRPATSIRVAVAIQRKDGSFRYVRSVEGRVRGNQWHASVRLRTPGVYRLTPKARGNAAAAARPMYVRAARARPLTGGAGRRAQRP